MGGGLLALLVVYLGASGGTRLAALALVGAACGITLYHADFGFTAAWRQWLTGGRGDGVRAQAVMLAVAVLLFFPALAAGSLFGRPVHGFLAPVGLEVAAGAFVFGIGMQLGNGCGSGTLYTLGGGSTRMVVTLVFFVVGSVAATAHLAWWRALPGGPPVSLIAELGLAGALAANLALFALVGWLTLRRDRRLPPPPPPTLARRRWLVGPWPAVAAAVALAGLNFATLALAGRPWGITSAFALWGAKAADGLGIAVADWPAWSRAALDRPLLADINTVMNLGIMLGAAGAAGLAGRFAPVWRVPLRSLAAAALGGLLLGYGARLAFGCNIGAFFGGIASASLHGYLWLAAALCGSVIGIRLRPWFGFADPMRKTIP